MVKVKIGNEEHEFTEAQFNYLKTKIHNKKIEVKEAVDWTYVGVYAGTFLLGYISSKAMDKLIEEIKKL